MLITTDHGPVRELRLDRPPVNALSLELILRLRQGIESSQHDGTGAIVISGASGRFSAGLDLPILLTHGEAEIKNLWKELYGLVRAIALCPVPTVGALTGHAPAGGTVISLFCDRRIMAEGNFLVGLNEVQVGIPLPPVLFAGLRRLVGNRHAENLAVSGALMSPQRALEVGLIDEVAPVDQVVQRAVQWCQGMLALPSNAMRVTRRLARADLTQLFHPDLGPEVNEVLDGWWHPDAQKTLRSVVERLGKKVPSRPSEPL